MPDEHENVPTWRPGGSDHGFGRSGPPPFPHSSRPGPIRILLSLLLAFAILYTGYFWFCRRVVVGPDEVLVLTRKDASRSLAGDQIIIPASPDPKDSAAYDAWQKEYGDVNGIMEKVYPAGVYFGFSPFDYEREVFNVTDTANVPNGKVGIVVKKFGTKLDPGQVLADPARDQRGPLPAVLQPGRYNQYANPYAYEIKQVDPIKIDPGYRGVVTLMAAKPPVHPNDYLVNDGEQGVQRQTEPEGFRYINPYAKRVIPVTIRSEKFAMVGDDAIRFPSSDSFDIRLEGFVEWSIIPDKLPLIYVQYAEGGQLVPFVEEKVILPYARSFCRLVGSQYNARDFISGDTKLKFQQEFENKLREACEKQGIEILQALVRDFQPPDAIKAPINEREVARQQIKSYEQQIQVAKSQADLETQTQTAIQNQQIGETNAKVVAVIKSAEQQRDVALTKAQQDLEVAKLRLQAAQKEADALVARAQADADVILAKKRAEAEPLRQQVAAFGDGDAYARFFFYQKVAPSVKSILTNTDGPFADVFRQFAQPPTTAPAESKTLTAAGGHP